MFKINKNAFLKSELTKKEIDSNFAKFHIMPIPLEKSVTFGKGTSKGPNAILKASNELERIYKNCEPCLKGIFTHPMVNCKENMTKTILKIQKLSMEISEMNKIPIGIGGEHTLTYGMVKGIKRGLDIKNENIGIIQIDAHADLRKKYNNKKFSHATVMYLLAKENFQIFQVGVRAISKEEIKLRKSLGIKFFEYDPNNFEQRSKKLLLPKNFPKKVYITLDVDALDPSIMPATGTPVPRGLSYENTLKALSILIRNRTVIGFDFVELSPIKNIQAYEFISASLIYEIMGLIELHN